MTVYLHERLAAEHVADLLAEAANERLARSSDRRRRDRRAGLLRRVAGWLAAAPGHAIRIAPAHHA